MGWKIATVPGSVLSVNERKSLQVWQRARDQGSSRSGNCSAFPVPSAAATGCAILHKDTYRGAH